MVTPLVVEGYENFLQFIEIYKSEDPLYILYTGSKLPNGDSWCPDCVEGNTKFFIYKIYHYFSKSFFIIQNMKEIAK